MTMTPDPHAPHDHEEHEEHETEHEEATEEIPQSGIPWYLRLLAACVLGFLVTPPALTWVLLTLHVDPAQSLGLSLTVAVPLGVTVLALIASGDSRTDWLRRIYQIGGWLTAAAIVYLIYKVYLPSVGGAAGFSLAGLDPLGRLKQIISDAGWDWNYSMIEHVLFVPNLFLPLAIVGLVVMAILGGMMGRMVQKSLAWVNFSEGLREPREGLRGFPWLTAWAWYGVQRFIVGWSGKFVAILVFATMGVLFALFWFPSHPLPGSWLADHPDGFHHYSWLASANAAPAPTPATTTVVVSHPGKSPHTGHNPDCDDPETRAALVPAGLICP